MVKGRMPVAAARLRVPLLLLFVVLVIMDVAIGFSTAGRVLTWLVLIAALAAMFVVGKVRADPVRVRFPVLGRWLALNSPANRVPSHGVHSFGQTYAIDLVHVPGDRPRPEFGSDAGFRRPEEFPAFGAPIVAPGDGIVVRACDGERDHRARNSWRGVLYLTVEGMLREIGGPRRVLGNHVIVDLGDAYTRHWHICGAARSRCGGASPCGPDSRSPSAATPGTPPSRTSTCR
jgi:hypothetical protein